MHFITMQNYTPESRLVKLLPITVTGWDANAFFSNALDIFDDFWHVKQQFTYTRCESQKFDIREAEYSLCCSSRCISYS